MEDLDTLARLHAVSRAGTTGSGGPAPGRDTLERMADACVLLGLLQGRVVASNTLDLAEADMCDTLVDPDWRRQGIGRRMVAAVEQLAVQFGITRLGLSATAASAPFFTACGYRVSSAGDDRLRMGRAFPRRQTRYGARIARLLGSIGIPAGYGRRHRLRLQEEARELATVGLDIHGREQLLHPDAAVAWHRLRHAAAADGVELQMASAFRSVGHQASIIEKKKLKGQDLENILAVSAAPGFSEHHTGRAVDVATPGSEALETTFDNTEAFEWLAQNAQAHGFRMSYPRNNRHGILYEPWHWFFAGP